MSFLHDSCQKPSGPPRVAWKVRALLGLCDRYYLLTEILGRADMMWHGGPDLWARDQSGRNRAGKPVQRQHARLGRWRGRLGYSRRAWRRRLQVRTVVADFGELGRVGVRFVE